MGRKSTIARLPEDIRDRLNALIRDGSATIDELVQEIEGMGGEASRSAVGRYKQKAEAQLARFREAQEVAGRWVEELGAKKDSQVGQLIAELLKTLTFQTLSEIGDAEEGPTPSDLMLLARTIKDTAAAQKTDHEYRRQIREEYEAALEERATEASAAVAEVAQRGGLSAADAEHLRAVILGEV